MTNIIINENNEMTFPFDPFKKTELIKEMLTENIFGDHVEKVAIYVKSGKELEERFVPVYEKNKILVATKLNDFLRKHKLITLSEAEMGYSPNLIYECLDAFSDLISWLNNYTPFIPTKQLVCAFMQINTNTYNKLQKSRDDDIATALDSIEEYIVDLTFTSSQNSMVQEKSTLSRLKTKGQGHNLMENQTEQQQTTTTFVLTNQAVLKKLEQIKNLEYRG